MTCKFFIPQERLNAVTTYYTEILIEAIKKSGFATEIISEVKDIQPTDWIVTIANKDFYRASKRRPAKQIHWFQGIIPEEAAMTFRGHWSKWPRILMHRLLERYILHRSDLNLYVSNAMKNHFAKIYGKIKGKDIIMPCFNSELQEDAFTEERYKKPTFVYAGSLHQWQCFEPMLELFKKIKELHPHAKLDVFTAEQDKARALAKMHQVEITTDCLPTKELNKRLTQYKYGFIIRENNPVNYVASPTKMNTYMAAGIIPIASDVVETYHENLSSYEYVLLFNHEKDILYKIAQLEQNANLSNNLRAEYKMIFETYWNRDLYIRKIADIINFIKD